MNSAAVSNVRTDRWVPPAAVHAPATRAHARTDRPVEQTLEPELVDAPSALDQRVAHDTDHVARPLAGVPEDEAVAEPRRPLQHRPSPTTEPDRDRRRRAGQDAGPLDVVEPTVERHDRLRPETPQHLDLLLQAPSPRRARTADKDGCVGCRRRA